MYKLYGIPNCDTVKKAKKHLDESGTSYEFINFKKEAPTKKFLENCKSLLGNYPINKRGTTFKKLKSDFENASETELISLMIENSSVIKRPILEKDNKIIGVGFKNGEFLKE